jgi:hypothetical protein
MFMGTFVEACLKTGWLVEVWVLRSNHDRLVLRTHKQTSWRGIRIVSLDQL